MRDAATTPTILVGTAGGGGRGHLAGLEEAGRRGLGCMEIQFTYGVRMRPDTAEAVGELARRLGIALSVHAPYYINLASCDEAKIVASHAKRVTLICESPEPFEDAELMNAMVMGRRAEA